jgi:hypothetical protein
MMRVPKSGSGLFTHPGSRSQKGWNTIDLKSVEIIKNYFLPIVSSGVSSSPDLRGTLKAAFSASLSILLQNV